MTSPAAGGGDLSTLLARAEGTVREELAALLLAYVRTRRWFRSKSRTPRAARVLDLIPVGPAAGSAASATVVAVLEIAYQGGEDDLYVIPLAGAPEGDGADAPAAIGILGGAGGIPLADGLALGAAASALFRIVREGTVLAGEAGDLIGEAAPLLNEVLGDSDERTLPTKVHDAEQTNSTITLGSRALLKIYRRLTPTPSPELEVGRFLSDARHPARVPRVLGALSYRRHDGREYSLGIAHEFLANDGDAWSLALRELDRLFDRVAGSPPPPEAEARPAAGRFVTLAETLGRRTGELHLALAGGDGDPDFAPEPLSAADRRALAARAGEMLARNLETLAASRERLGADGRRLADRLLAPEARGKVMDLLKAFHDCPLDTVKIRIHGDLHLGQVLCRGDDFLIIDFEGEPSRPLAERRAKSSPVRDVMGMARSFDYAPEAALRERGRRTGQTGGAANAALAGWGKLWTREVTSAFSGSYLATVRDAAFVPRTADELTRLFTFYELERVIYEIGYELDHRPDWAEIPLRGLAALLEGKGGMAR